MALPLRVTVSPERAQAAPGETLTFDITIRNASDIVEHYGVDVVGLPDEATAHTEPDVAKLRPGEGADLKVRLTFPGTPPPPAGTYILGVVAASKYRNEVSRCVELPIDIAPVGGIAVSVAPEIAMGGGSGTFTVDVTNSGNTAQQLRLAATDPERRVATRFAPPTVDLAPGGRANSVLTVNAAIPWSKEKTQKLTIEALANDPAGGPAPVVVGTGAATFVQQPRFASKLTRIIGIAAAVLLVAAAIATPALVDLLTDDPPPAAQPGAPAGSAPAGAPSTPQGAPSTAAPPTPAGGASSAAGPGGSAPVGVPGGPPGGASAAGSASATSGTALPPRTVDLTAPGGTAATGILPSDAFRNDGMLVSADPGAGAAPGCENARAVAVVDDGAGGRVLVSADPNDATRCQNVPLMIDFLQDGPAGSVTVLPGTKDALTMEVAWRDLSRTTEADLAASADPQRGGIDYVLLRSKTPGGTTPIAVRSITFSPA